MNIILASASPRRKELLGYITEKFECVPADIDETVPENISADESAEYLACMKASHISRSYPDSVVIGCDTVVVYDGEVYGKPADEADAERMLKNLSGKVHKVITGVCMCMGEKKESFSEITEVEFFELSDEDIRKIYLYRENEPGLQTLKSFLDKHVGDAISTVHLLPMFPYTSDDGFSVVDYKKINPVLGDWEDIDALAKSFDKIAKQALKKKNGKKSGNKAVELVLKNMIY